MIHGAVKGAAVAAAVCSLFAAGAGRAAEKMEKPKEAAKVVQCAGINACKGQGACAGADNACKAQNACKGHGWAEARSAQECMEKGGKVLAKG